MSARWTLLLLLALPLSASAEDRPEACDQRASDREVRAFCAAEQGDKKRCAPLDEPFESYCEAWSMGPRRGDSMCTSRLGELEKKACHAIVDRQWSRCTPLYTKDRDQYNVCVGLIKGEDRYCKGAFTNLCRDFIKGVDLGRTIREEEVPVEEARPIRDRTSADRGRTSGTDRGSDTPRRDTVDTSGRGGISGLDSGALGSTDATASRAPRTTTTRAPESRIPRGTGETVWSRAKQRWSLWTAEEELSPITFTSTGLGVALTKLDAAAASGDKASAATFAQRAVDLIRNHRKDVETSAVGEARRTLAAILTELEARYVPRALWDAEQDLTASDRW